MSKSKNIRIIKSGLRVIGRYKLRTFFMMLGIIIGITALTVTLTIGNGIEKKIMDNVSRIFNNNNVVVSAEMIQAEGIRESESGPNTTLRIEDIEVIVSQLEGLVMYDYLQILPEQDIVFKQNNTIANIKGCREIGEMVWNRPVSEGEFFNKSDVNSSKRVAVIGTKVAAALFPNDDPIGKQIRIANSPYLVKGVMEARGADPHGSDMDEEIYIPITTFMRRLANVDFIMAAKFEFENQEIVEGEAEKIRTILREQHSISEGEIDDFSVLTPKQVSEIISTMTKLFKVLLPAIAVIALLAGGIVIVVLMTISVNQRVREIGLRKAIGAKNNDIRFQFLTESTIIVLIGGILGLVIGLIFAKLISNQMNASFYIPLQTVVASIFLPIITGLLAAIMPANKAAKYHPVETLK